MLEALGEDTGTGVSPLTVAESKANELRFMPTRWSRVTATLEGIGACIAAQQQDPDNNAPTVSSAIADATIVNESGTMQVSLTGVFGDADNDSLTITAASDDTAVATVSVAADGSSLTVTAQSRGTATITVTASDGNGGSVEDAFTVVVKAAPAVASALADVTGLAAGATQDISLSGVFSDADGDTLTVSAASSGDAIATVSLASDGSKLTLAGVAEGTTTITITAQDSDGNTVSDFDVSVVKAAELLGQQGLPRCPTLYADATIVNESGTRSRSLSLAYSATPTTTALTVTAASSDDDQGYGVGGVGRVQPDGERPRSRGSGHHHGNRQPTVTAARYRMTRSPSR